MSKITDTLICLFLVALSLIVIGRDSLFSWFLIFLMVPYITKVIIGDVFSPKGKYHFGTYLFLTILLFFTYLLLSAILKTLHAIFLAIIIFFLVAYLMLVKPDRNVLRDDFSTLRTSFRKKLILPIVFGIIGCLAGTVIAETFTGFYMNWLYSIMPGVAGGAGVGFGAKIGKFKTKEKALTFLGMVMGLISVTLSYHSLLIFSDLIIFSVLFLGGLCGGYVGVSSWDLEREREKSAGTIKYPHILEGIRSINSKSNEAARMAGRGSIIFGVIYLLPAYFLAKNPFTFLFLFIVFSGVIIGNSIGFTAWLIRNNVKEAVRSAEKGCVMGGLIGYIVPHLLGDPSAWTTGILGVLIGHRMGFALWYAKSNPYEEVTKAKDGEERLAAATSKIEKTMYETETYLNDKYGFSIEYPKSWLLDIGGPKPEFFVGLSIQFGIPRKVACSIVAGPIGPTIYGRTPKEVENRAGIHRRNLNANLLSSKRLTIDGIDAYEHVYTAKQPRRYVKQVGFFKDNDEYLLFFGVFSEEDVEKYESTFDKCIQSFRFKKQDKEMIKRSYYQKKD